MSEERKEQSTGYDARIVIIALSLAFIFIIVGCSIYRTPCWNKAQMYADACDLMAEYKFEEAFDLLSELPLFYEDSDFLKAYCKSRIAHKNGDLMEAYHLAENCYYRIEKCHVPDSKEYKAILSEIKPKYERQKEDKFLQELKNKLPYEGLSEKYMHQTVLGVAKVDKNWNRYSTNNKHYLTNRYTYYQNGQHIYTAICANGSVIGVYEESGYTLSSNHSSSSKKTNNYDPLEAASYSNEEDFYDDNYDYFSDYYEAEEYYLEHH